ncbi:MAG: N-formylglutamate amidohydrolase [Burkholderiaceae bacterium]
MIPRRSEDAHIDDLFGGVVDAGGVLLAAEFPRCYIDPNRTLADIDPAMLVEPGRSRSHPRAKPRGAGLIWRQVKRYGRIYDRPLAVGGQARIEQCWRPYHEAIARLIDDTHRRHGLVLHLNCHSMASMGDETTEDGCVARPEFVLGDRDGTSCAPWFTDTVREVLEAAGYQVAINNPYKGQELVVRYSDPAAGRHSLQIEINRALYMNEDTLPHLGYRRRQATWLTDRLVALQRTIRLDIMVASRLPR